MPWGVNAKERGSSERNDVSVGEGSTNGGKFARIGDSEGTDGFIVVFCPPLVGRMCLASDAAELFGEGHSEDVVEVEMGEQDVFYLKLFGCQETSQCLLFVGILAGRVDDGSLVRVVPNDVGVGGEDVELECLQADVHSMAFF